MDSNSFYHLANIKLPVTSLETAKSRMLGLLHLFTIQEAARLKDIILHIYNNMLTGQLYKTSVELLLIELGMGPK